MRTERLALLLAAAAVLAACGFDAPNYIPPPLADPQAGCAIDCHGDATSNAPPMSISMVTDTTSVSVGAHRSHLKVAPDWHRQVDCADCHVVPADVNAPGHMDDDDRRAEVTFGMIAGPDAAWNGTTCTTRCHGSTEKGGMHPTPTWTRVDDMQATCGSCHGNPPPSPHPPAATSANCSTCHPTMEDATTFRVPERHIDGIIDRVAPDATGGCTTCHGTAGGSAGPPKGLGGTTLPDVRGVGAHAAHRGSSPWHRAITCSACHLVPDTQDAPGHIDPGNVAEVRFTNLNPRAAYSTTTALCSNLYCHGNGRDNNGSKSWILPGALTCNGCHSVTGTNMSGAHRAHLDATIECATCHSTVIKADRTFLDATLHVNGVHEVKLVTGTWEAAPDRRRCQNTGCHGTRVWDGERDDDRDGRPGGGGPGGGGFGGGGR